MSDDEREGYEPEEQDATGDPAPSTSAQEAFEALRRTIEAQGAQTAAEMTIIRRGVEAAFDQFEKFQQPADYSADLGRIVQQLAIIAERLEAVEQSPILKNGPEHYARAIERSGESLVRAAAQQFENKGRDLERVSLELSNRIKSAHERERQDRRMWLAGTAGIVAGVLLVLFLPRILPFSADTRLAAAVLAQDRWNAGVTLMRAADPAGWRGVVDASQLVRDNAEAIIKCRKAVQEAGKSQKCPITVTMPEQ